MKRLSTVLLIALLAGFNAYLLMSRMNSATPRAVRATPQRARLDNSSGNSVIQFLDDRIDAGQIKYGDRKRVQIRLKNISSEPVEVMSVQTTCSCFSKVGDVGGPFAPGAVKVIEMDLQPKRGSSNWPVLIQLHNTQQYRFEVSGTVRVDAIASPERIDLGEIAVGHEVQATVSILGDEESHLSPDGHPTVSADWIRSSLELVEVPKTQGIDDRDPFSKIASIRLSIKPNSLGNFQEFVTVKLKSAGSERLISVPVSGRAVTEVVARPSSLRFKAGSTRTVQLRSHTGPFQLRGLTSDVVELVGDLPTGPVDKLDLVLRPRDDHSVKMGELVLDVLGKAPLTIRVPVAFAEVE